MTFSKQDVEAVLNKVKLRLSSKRFLHTVGVVRAAEALSMLCIPDSIYELCVAAALHDVAKEYDTAAQLKIIRERCIPITSDDEMSPAVLHSYAAVAVIDDDFSEYATENVKSAVYNHTVGSPDMTVFDEIIFLADYIEETRKYESCVSLRNKVFSSMKAGEYDSNIRLLHTFCIEAISNTYKCLVERKSHVNSKMLLTANALKCKI